MFWVSVGFLFQSTLNRKQESFCPAAKKITIYPPEHAVEGKQNKDFWSWRCFGRMWETEHVNEKWLLTLRRLRTVVDRRS